MAKLVKIKPLDNHQIWLRYSDNTEGVADLSDIVGRGAFKALQEQDLFKSAYISEYGTLAWNEDLEVCADSLYLQITGKKVEEIMPKAKNLTMDA